MTGFNEQTDAALTTTLDGLLSYNAVRDPDAVALVDLHSAGAPRRLTYRAVECAVCRVAERLRLLALPPGSTVALQAANTGETVVALLAILRAGFIAAPIPLLWRHGEARALAGIEARALIAASGYGDAALSLAAATFSVRYVATFGRGLSDGMVPLGEITDEMSEAPMPRALPHDPRRQAVLTFETGADGHLPCRRTHAAMIVGGAAVTLEAAIRRHAVLVSSMMPSSFAVLSVGVVPWLLSGGTLALHQPFQPEVFLGLVEQVRPDVVTLPGPLLSPLLEAGVIRTGAATVIALWRSPERHRASPRWTGEAPLVDILSFGETGLVPLRRLFDGKPSPLMAGQLATPVGEPGAMIVAKLARSDLGTLAFGGPMAPLRPVGEDPVRCEMIDTGLPCRLDSNGALILSGAPLGTVSVGGYRFALQELHDVVDRATPQALLAALPDLLTGHKLAGSGADAETVRNTIAEAGASPLVSAAFRDRQTG